jgi:transposase
MWTAADRRRYGRDGQRYPSDLTDAEWALIAPLIRPAKRGGRRRSVVVREVMNGLLYVLETGCQWRHLPRDLPPRSTVNGYLQRWDWDGTLEAVHHRLYVACRERAGKEASPTAAILDSKSVKAGEKILWGAGWPGVGRLGSGQPDQGGPAWTRCPRPRRCRTPLRRRCSSRWN